jgi:zona occludens toxin
LINGIAGKPGGGKSYEAVKNHVIPALKDGRMVVTNLPLQIEHFVAVFGEQVRDLIVIVDYNYHDYGSAKPFSVIGDWLKHQDWKNVKGQGVLFCIDEAHLSLPNGKGSAEFTKVLEFLSMHRHYGFDVLLITQNFKKVHRDIRDMVQLVYRCIKKSMFGQDDQYIIKVHEGCTTQVVNTDEREYESYVFKFYKSHTKSEGQIVEATTRDVTPWHKTGLMKFSYVIMFFAFLMIVNVIHKITKDDEDVVFEEVVEVEVAKPTVNPVVADNSARVISTVNTVDGVITTSSSVAKPKSKSKPEPVIKTPADLEEEKHDRIIAMSKERHPFHKVGLSISGFAHVIVSGSLVDFGVNLIYFSAQQNGQHVFTISSKDLLLAGYDVQVLSECMVILEFHKYMEYITCNRQSIGVKNPVAEVALNN